MDVLSDLLTPGPEAESALSVLMISLLRHNKNQWMSLAVCSPRAQKAIMPLAL